MTDRHWHTPSPLSSDPAALAAGRPASDPFDQENRGALERLLRRHGNPKSTPLGQADELTLLMTYEQQFGAVAVEPLRQRPERHAYKMMAALARDDDIRAWLAEWRRQGLDIGPFEKEQVEPPFTLDVRMPNGMIRHLHDTAVAANRGRPIMLGPGLVDPYLGTGLDPTHLSGIVAPYRSTLTPYMACCGQELGNKGEIPPGCWIPLDPNQQPGTLVPYQVWFQRMAPDAIWNALQANTAGALFLAETQLGTAFLDYAYYQELDRRIRALLAIVVPAVMAAQLALLQAQFQNAPVLAPEIRDDLRELVSLVLRYNAPQMGADCLHTIIVDDAFIEERILFVSAGKRLMAQGRLATEKEVYTGLKLPVLYRLDEIRTLLQKVQTYGDSRLNALEAALESVETVYRSDDNRKIDAYERLRTNVINALGYDVFESIVQLRPLQNAIQRNLTQFMKQYNTWLDDGDNFDLTLVAKKCEESHGRLREALRILPEETLMQRFLAAFNTVTEDQKNQSIAASVIFKNDDQDIPSVRRWAQLKVAAPSMIRLIPSTEPKLTRVEATLKTQAEKEVNGRRAAQEEARQRQAAALVRPPPPATQTRSNIIPVTLDARDRDPTPVDLKTWIISDPLEYANESCTYDSMFAAMFAIPNQWFRQQILEKKQTTRLATCEENDVKSIDRTMVSTINYFEGRLRRPRQDVVCPTTAIWNQCLPQAENVESLAIRRGNPLMLLNRLMQFYGLSDHFRIYAQQYNTANWMPEGMEEGILDEVQLYAVTAENTRLLLSRDFAYNVPIEYGDFTILSCIIYSGDHWQACVRHPGTGQWYRMLDDGTKQLLRNGNLKPAEITSSTDTDPKRTKGATGWNGPTAIYEPMIWFYVRTSALAGFKSTQMGSSQSKSTMEKLDFESDQRLITLFGRLTSNNRIRPFYYDDQAAGAQVELGIAQILSHLNHADQTYIEKKATSVTSLVTQWVFGDEIDYINAFNQHLHRYLRPLLEQGIYSSSGPPLSKDILDWFRKEATSVNLYIYDSTLKRYFVPEWSTDAAPRFHVWPKGVDPKTLYPLIGKAWGNLLHILLMVLLNVRTENSAFTRAMDNHEIFKQELPLKLEYVTNQLTMADAFHWESKDEHVKYVVSQLQQMDELDELYSLRLQQLRNHIDELEGRAPEDSIHSWCFTK